MASATPQSPLIKRLHGAGYRQEECFYRNPRHSLLRAHDPQNRTVVIKTTVGTPAPAAAMLALRHEFEILRQLDSPNIVRALDLHAFEGGLALILEDAGRQDLQAQLQGGPVGLDLFFRISIQLVAMLDALSRRGLIHRELTPSNLVSDQQGRLTLIDFEMATELESPAPRDEGLMNTVDAVTYMSPERGGRTGRRVDYRADFYSVGAIFYHLLTGRPPFVTRDPLELTYAHLAERPVPPHERNREVPEQLSALCMKLLEKEPEARYQTAWALRRDLLEARQRWQSSGQIENFPLARGDVAESLRFPEKLYGREPERAALRALVDEACAGKRRLALVSGPAGIGKSALLEHLQPEVMALGGNFLIGKFNQLRQGKPFAVLIEAFEGLTRRLLTLPEAKLACWRQELTQAVGGKSGRLLTDLIASLSAILGPQPPVAQLAPWEARNRFTKVFLAFMRACASADHPLLLFLDDAQWADAESLRLIERLLSDPEASHLLTVLAYRDQEIGPEHPLHLLIENVSSAGIVARSIKLGGLESEIAALLHDALGAPLTTVRPLAGPLTFASGGNPFALRQALHELVGQHLLHFDRERRVWTWDLERIRTHAPTGAGAEILLTALHRVPLATRELLSVAACIGDTAALTLIAACVQQPVSKTAKELWPALQAGLLHPLGEAYRLPHEDDPSVHRLNEVSAVYRFVHDRIRTAAYQRLEPRQRAMIHLSIGRRLQQNAKLGTLFKTVDHLNFALEVIEDPAERLRLAELNLKVGREAKSATAYSNALEYFAAGMRCLPAGEQGWNEYADLSFSLHRERAECAYLTGKHELAEQLVAEALLHTPERDRQAELANVRIVAATLAGDYAHAIRIGTEVLELFEIRLPRQGVREATQAQLQQAMQLLEHTTPEAMLGAAPMSQPEQLQAMELLANLAPSAYLGAQELLGFIVGKMLELSLVYGHSLYTSEAYTGLAFVYGTVSGDQTRAYAIGELGVEFARRYGSAPLLCRALYLFGNHINHWHKPLASNLPVLREGFRVGSESGELQFAAYCALGQVLARSTLGHPLSDVIVQAEEGERFARKAGNASTTHTLVAHGLHSRILQGTPDSKAVERNARERNTVEQDERGGQQESWDRHCQEAPDATADCMAQILSLRGSFLLGDYPGATTAAANAGAVLHYILGLIPTAEYRFYAGLAATADLRGGSAEERLSRRQCALPHLRALIQYAAHCPENFYHRQLLLQAESARLEGRDWDAMQQYTEAAERARIQGFMLDEAVANELAGEFFSDHEEWRYAAIHLQAAYKGYRQWGATAKLRQMERHHSHLLESTPGQPAASDSGPNRRIVDTAGLLRASQAISQQLALPDLLRTLLEITLKVAGAEHAYLLLEQEGDWWLRAYGPASDGQIALVTEPARHRTELPQRILEFVRRSNETVVLDDAHSGGLFADDPAVRDRRIRSVLCIPISRQDKTVGALYLENNLTPYAFTPAKVEPLRHLATQAAISLESSSLVEALQRNQELYSTLAKHFPRGAVYLFDRQRRIVVAEGLGLAEAGLSGEEMADRTPKEVFGPIVGARIETLMGSTLVHEDASDQQAKDQETSDEIVFRGRIYQLQMAPIRDSQGKVTLGMALAQDITERKSDEEQLRLAAKVFEGSAESIVITDAEQRVVLVNRAFTTLTGYAPDKVVGRESKLLRPRDRFRHRQLWDSLHARGHWQGEIRLRHKSGEQVPVWLALTAVHDQGGRLTHYVAIASDISERKAAEERIRFLAYYDALTQLPNRVLLNERLRLAMAMAQRDRHRIAVLFLDLDRFKHINDSLGHAAGDRLLQAVARRLKTQLREEDTVSRLGGDEFIIVLSEIDDPNDAARAAEKIHDTFKHSFLLEGHEIRTSTSIGISVYPDDAKSPDALIKHADAAMYHAKAHGKNKYQFFTHDLNVRAYEHLFIENALRQALERDELSLYYQAQVDARTGLILGAEALMRWHHPKRGLVPPSQFIPLAEETGQIVELGEWALRSACRQNRAWQAAGLPPITIAVNLAAEHFRQPNFTDSIAAVLAQTELEPRWLELELTERTVMEDAEATTRTLSSLKSKGMSLAIDDFGTGYSSLAYLKSFPIDKLKIDQSFIRDVTDYPDDAIITRSIISLGHNLRLQVIAEGVESAAHVAFLQAEHCDAMQGNYFARPLPAADFALLMSRGVSPAHQLRAERPPHVTAPLRNH